MMGLLNNCVPNLFKVHKIVEYFIHHFHCLACFLVHLKIQNEQVKRNFASIIFILFIFVVKNSVIDVNGDMDQTYNTTFYSKKKKKKKKSKTLF